MMKVPYPELLETTTRVAKVIETEEEHFISTVDSGLEKIAKIFKSVNQSRNREVAGHDIFDMYQTFGFPPELFETMAAEQNFQFDWTGFKREMERHGEISGSTGKNLLFKNDPLESVKKQYGRTEFLGYEADECESKVLAILADGTLVDAVTSAVGMCGIVLDKTTFYGEKGGQVGDWGCLRPMADRSAEEEKDAVISFVVHDAQVDGELIIHYGEGDIKVGDQVLASHHPGSRQAIARAHTATHILHSELRDVLGAHAEQQGSKVSEDELRFDFTHHQAVDKITLMEIERNVNTWILNGNEVCLAEMPIDEARKTGAMMLFGEKYPERVRVVSVHCPYQISTHARSIEFCGGTHVENLSEIGLFKIISEESVSAGIRRITALTGLKAVERVQSEAAIVQQLTTTLKIPTEEIPAKVETLADQVKKLQKQIKTADGKRQTGDGRRQTADGRWESVSINPDDLIKCAENVGGVKLIMVQLSDMDVNAVRQLLDQIRQKSADAVALLALVSDGKVNLLAGVGGDLVDKYSAVELLRRVAPLVGGKCGGGRPDFAQSGGSDAGKLAEVFAEAKKYFA
jgi:alanyl-tRNA synthetase